jgi:hypothetical protein
MNNLINIQCVPHDKTNDVRKMCLDFLIAHTQNIFLFNYGRKLSFMHPLGPTWNKEMFDDGNKIMQLGHPLGSYYK